MLGRRFGFTWWVSLRSISNDSKPTDLMMVDLFIVVVKTLSHELDSFTNESSLKKVHGFEDSKT